MQFLADILDAPVERPVVQETTALGAAWLAGHKAGVWPDAEGFAKLWKLERAFTPALAAAERARKYAGWQRSVRAVLQTARG
jgi:glycerol kinase